jgi:hypothetical protein
MKTLEVDLEGISPLSFSRDHREPKKESKSGAPQETADEYEQRTWPAKLHVMDDGQIYIPPMAIKSAIEGAASYNPVKKKGPTSWTKHIVQGVMIVDEILLFGEDGAALRAEAIKAETVLCYSDGKPARYSKGGKVPRTFPKVPAGWRARAKILVLDEQIPNTVVEQHIQDAGTFVGIGRWRAEKRGLYGRFRVTKMKWS